MKATMLICLLLAPAAMAVRDGVGAADSEEGGSAKPGTSSVKSKSILDLRKELERKHSKSLMQNPATFACYRIGWEDPSGPVHFYPAKEGRAHTLKGREHRCTEDTTDLMHCSAIDGDPFGYLSQDTTILRKGMIAVTKGDPVAWCMNKPDTKVFQAYWANNDVWLRFSPDTFRKCLEADTVAKETCRKFEKQAQIVAHFKQVLAKKVSFDICQCRKTRSKCFDGVSDETKNVLTEALRAKIEVAGQNTSILAAKEEATLAYLNSFISMRWPFIRGC